MAGLICSICWTPKLDEGFTENKPKNVGVKMPKSGNTNHKKKEVNLNLSDEEIYDLYGFENFDVSDEADNQHLTAEDDPMKNFSSDTDTEPVIPGDNLLLTLNMDENAGFIDVFVYNDNKKVYFPHHDIIVGKKPLCFDYIGRSSSSGANNEFCAVGFGNSVIEVWNLSDSFVSEPAAILGSTRKRKITKLRNISRGLQQDVTDLHWNWNEKNFLGSCYADCSAKIWDINEGSIASNFSGKRSKFLHFKWNPSSPRKFLTVDDSKFLNVFDQQTNKECWEMNIGVLGHSKKSSSFYRSDLAFWSPTDDQKIITFGRKGRINVVDMRMPTNFCWTHKVSCGSITGADVSSYMNGTVACLCKNGYVVLNSLEESNAGNVEIKKKQIHEMCYEIKFSPDNPNVAAFGVKPGNLRLVDFDDECKVSCVED